MLAVTKEMTPYRLVEKMRYMINSHPELGYFAAFHNLGDTVLTDRIPTACTDGLNTKYCGSFLMSLPMKQVLFVGLHEDGHIAYRHIFEYADLIRIDPVIANLSMDYWLNLMLMEWDPDGKFIELPCDKNGDPFVCYDKKFVGWGIRKIFKYLRDENEREVQKEQEDKGNAESGESGESGESEGTGQANELDDYSQSIKDRVAGMFDSHEFDKLIDECTKEELQEIDDLTAEAVHKASRAYGNDLSGGMKRGLLHTTNSPVDWRIVLQEYMTQSTKVKEYSSYRRFNRRMQSQGIYMPSTTGESTGEWVLAIDTSCSRDDTILSKTCAKFVEMCHTIKPSKVHVMYWDTKVCGEEMYDEYEYDDILKLTTPVGGGGTDPDCVLYKVQENMANNTYQNSIDGIIMFTDGHFYQPTDEWRALDIPLLWAIDGDANRNVEVPCGSTIFIEE